MEKKDRVGFRENAEIKRKATIILQSMGLDISSACQILLRQIIKTGSFPLKIESSYTEEGERLILEADAQIEQDLKNGTAKKYSSADELFEEI